jgi:hypothetical protein
MSLELLPALTYCLASPVQMGQQLACHEFGAFPPVFGVG